MPRYFFNVHDEYDIADDEGKELQGVDEARAQAIGTAGEMLRDMGREGWPGIEWNMEVSDETGATVCVLKFSARC
jgi:hypothetical protein